MKRRRPFRVCLTGGIASGKSTIAKLFAALGVPVIDSDEIARAVVQPGQPALAAIAARFGPAVLTAGGELDRRALRERVFADRRQRADLEAIMHPAIRAEMERASEAAQEPYQLLVIPLFVETGRHTSVDRVLVVDCPEELQIRRVMARDNTTEARAREALAAQASREERLACADDVIVNDGDIATLRDAVESLHRRYLTLAVYASGPRQAE